MLELIGILASIISGGVWAILKGLFGILCGTIELSLLLLPGVMVFGLVLMISNLRRKKKSGK